MEKKIIGIIGGMGPMAAADLFQKIILHTKASTDQEHLRVLMDNNTNIPDRTAALLSGGADPLPPMLESARLLERAGAQLLAMPCNTGHCYYTQLQQAVGIPLLNMIDLTCQALTAQGITRAGLLATSGTLQTNIYQEACRKYGISLVIPYGEEQAAVMSLIYDGVKAGRQSFDTAAATETVEQLFRRGAQTMILGCTELPMAVEWYHMQFPYVDSTLELAKAAITAAGGQVI